MAHRISMILHRLVTVPAALLPAALPAAAVLLTAVLLAAPRFATAEEAPLLTYNVDVVSNYVWRGIDAYTAVYDKEGKAHGAFQAVPTAQPSVTLNGPGGLSLGLWGSWALTNRAPEDSKGFDGLKTLDEVDYTLSWAWDNRLGAFSAGLVLYTLVPENGVANELFFSITPKALDAVGGSLTHYVGSDAAGTGATYTQFAMGGGEAVNWGLSLGLSHALQDVTAKIGMPLGPVSVAFNAAYRPNPELVGPYDTKGKYDVAGKTEDYPPAVFWLTLSYGGAVAP